LRIELEGPLPPVQRTSRPTIWGILEAAMEHGRAVARLRSTAAMKVIHWNMW
jgi:hypothetical protein